MKQPTTGGRWAYDPATDELTKAEDAPAQAATTAEAAEEPAQDETTAADPVVETETPATGKKGK